jgi:endonuclease YncB( thermonuclease family)
MFSVVRPAIADAPATYRWEVLEVTDGDTIKVTIPGLPAELNPIGVRLRGINTPETGSRAACTSERVRGERAKAEAKRLVATAIKAGQPIEFREVKWDKYGGRVDARVLLGGRDLARTLILMGLGRPYDGGKRAGWC